MFQKIRALQNLT